MSTFPNSPRLIKGALVGVDVFSPLGSVVVFQYNPDTMTRRLEARAASGDGDRGKIQGYFSRVKRLCQRLEE